MKRFLPFCMLAMAAAGFCGCGECDDITGPDGRENLIVNHSFEDESGRSLGGWVFDGVDEPAFSENVPAGGGCWSVGLMPGWIPQTNSLAYTVAAPPGTHIFEFTFKARRDAVDGLAKLVLKRPDVILIRRTIGISSAGWTTYSVMDTITAEAGDSIVVHLDGGVTEVAGGHTWYDLVKLFKLD